MKNLVIIIITALLSVSAVNAQKNEVFSNSNLSFECVDSYKPVTNRTAYLVAKKHNLVDCTYKAFLSSKPTFNNRVLKVVDGKYLQNFAILTITKNQDRVSNIDIKKAFYSQAKPTKKLSSISKNNLIF